MLPDATACSAFSTICVSAEDHGLLWDGMKDEDAILSRMQPYGIDALVLKLDKPGCIVVTAQDGRVYVPAVQEASAVDITAAGDSFAAARLAARRWPGPEGSRREWLEWPSAGPISSSWRRGAIIPIRAMPRDLHGLPVDALS